MTKCTGNWHLMFRQFCALHSFLELSSASENILHHSWELLCSLHHASPSDIINCGFSRRWTDTRALNTHPRVISTAATCQGSQWEWTWQLCELWWSLRLEAVWSWPRSGNQLCIHQAEQQCVLNRCLSAHLRGGRSGSAGGGDSVKKRAVF